MTDATPSNGALPSMMGPQPHPKNSGTVCTIRLG